MTEKDIIERLARIEEKTSLKFAEMEKALVLARELVEKERVNLKDILDDKLEGMNQFQKRMDKLEGTFATKSELAIVSRVVYIGMGIFLALEFYFRFIDK